MRSANLLLVSLALALCGAGCRTTPAATAAHAPASAPAVSEDERIRELEARVARLEARPSDLDDEILAREVERVALLTLYTPDHPTVVALDLRIRALGKARADEHRARREKMAQRLELERETLLVMYTEEHDRVRRLDAQIAFLRSDAP